MEGRSFLRRKDREALRERWLLRAEKAFERMFAEANQDQMVTFTDREDMACVLGKELAAFLLEEHAAADNQVRLSEKRPPCCPKCKQPTKRIAHSNENLPECELTTRAGEIKLRRERWHCAEAILQVRAVYLSEDDRASTYWSRLAQKRECTRSGLES